MKHMLFMILCNLIFTAFVIADIINVPADIDSIQGGINLASNGDTVLVADGLYYENINFKGKTITVASHFLINADTSHIYATTINGSQPNHPDSASAVLFVSGEDTTSILCGFTITAGTGTIFQVTIPTPPYNLTVRFGGGITMYNSGAKIIQNHIVQNNLNDPQVHECAGGGIASGSLALSSWAIIEDNLIQNNSCTNGTLNNTGGGLSIFSNAKICGNIIRNNMASSTTQQSVGGGLHFEGGDSLTVRDNIVAGNQALTNSSSRFGVGGGMYFMRKDSAFIRVLDNLIYLNQTKSSYWSGGNGLGFDSIKGDILVANNLIYDNDYTGNQVSHGGGIYVTNSEVQIINNTITGNEADYGGGVCNRFSEETVYINNIFWDNESYIGQNEIEIIKNTGEEDPLINYCDISGGWPGLGNIGVNPLFTDSLFQISDSSECIGRGASSYNFRGITYNVPEIDLLGNLRPSPGSRKPDIGAIENLRGYPFLPCIQIPDDYSSIQAGVNAALAGDTVLVAEGTYFENISIQSKSLTLASYFLLDGDTSHITETIINGSQPNNPDSGSVIMMFNSLESIKVCGFTLTGGSGKKTVWPNGTFSLAGGGVYIEHASVEIINNYIINNSIISPPQTVGTLGGGIMWGANMLSGFSLKISGNLISGNLISGSMTGGAGINISNYYIGAEFDYLIEKNIIENNIVINTDNWKAMGGGIFLDFCLPTIGNQIIKNNIIRNNSAQCPHSFGGGLYFIIRDTEVNGTVDTSPSPYICNNIISGNHSDYLGGGISVWRAYYIPGFPATPLQTAGNYVPKPSFINNTIVNNTAQDGSGFYIMNDIPLIMNNILWNDYPANATWGEIFLGDEPQWTAWVEPNTYGGAEISYTDIQDTLWSGTGNITEDPLFSDTLYHLGSGSPCINAGNPAPACNDSDNTRNDMGAYGGIPDSLVKHITGFTDFDDKNAITREFELKQNYPNPFNPTTIIQYNLPKPTKVTIKIFNILGQEICTLIDGIQKSGLNTVSWDGKNESGHTVGSGIYIYQIQTGTWSQSRKMLLMK